jgi:hypothetical protein
VAAGNVVTLRNASGKKTVYPHVVMRSTAKWALEVAEKVKAGSFYQSLVCCLAMAFTLEAYFNFLGAEVFPEWVSEYEKKPPKEKLKALAKKVGYKLDHKSSEYDAFTRVFALRNALVHGKVTVVSGSWNTAQRGKSAVDALQTDWEKFGTPKEAKKIYESCVKLVNALHAAAALPGRAFGSSMHGISHIL